MSEIHPVSADVAEHALIDKATYEEMYARSVNANEEFWAEQGERVTWIKPFTKVKDVSYAKDDLHIRWYYDGTLNACYNCVDRHLDTRRTTSRSSGKVTTRTATSTLPTRTACRRLQVRQCLKELGAKKGDRVTIYMPMIPEAAVAMLACARIGAVHSVVFGGFSPDALAGRIHDCDSNIVITADEGLRGGKTIPLKANVDAAAERPNVYVA